MVEWIKEKEYYEKYDQDNITIIGLAIKEVKLRSSNKIDIKCNIEKKP
ncbi:MAG: hypothetical protein LBT66_03220 [Methanobrevibacter sp.]|nr:hypothetical protein [Candidatus Methanovirga meridionalis]